MDEILIVSIRKSSFSNTNITITNKFPTISGLRRLFSSPVHKVSSPAPGFSCTQFSMIGNKQLWMKLLKYLLTKPSVLTINALRKHRTFKKFPIKKFISPFNVPANMLNRFNKSSKIIPRSDFMEVYQNFKF